MKSGFFIIGTMSACLGVAPALAKPALDDPDLLVRTQHVRHADLDLTSKQGRIRLNQRINHAVEAVCTLPNPGGLITMQEKRCLNVATVDARGAAAVAVARAYQRREAVTLLAQR